MRHAFLIHQPSRPGRTFGELTSRYLPAGRASGPAASTQVEFSTDLPGFEFLVTAEKR
jgi:hypothetical protein